VIAILVPTVTAHHHDNDNNYKDNNISVTIRV